MKTGLYIFTKNKKGELKIVPLRQAKQKVWDDMIHKTTKTNKKVKKDIW